ncbi:hypothetical protein K1T71_006404 [Dendrolimus kikuchii]|uniref:Uncharacterized protein n=1 Tax=Dendrolimus kikuchii TaxID=765133 RepID=A0ACC1D116_9NEOP|nr:hypothetical protein K1T71_006404 [Dendrolimus kikuchii]
MVLTSDCNSKDDYQLNRVNEVIPDKSDVKVHSYEEAITLAGNGWYNRCLLAVLSLGLLGMGVDIFGFSVIVTGATCDFHLGLTEKSILMSMPFIVRCVRMGLNGALLFVPTPQGNWREVMYVCICSAAQSTTYALIGESCSQAVRGFYMLIMTSVLMLYLLSYVVPGYFILNLKFSLNIGLITFTPWRLLAIVLALPLGLCAVGLNFLYESPKFLINAGREHEALDNLKKIWRWNGGEKNSYPVSKVILDEENNVGRKEVSILQSLRKQTVPIFRPPLIWKTMQLFYLTAVIYVVNNGLVMWFPSIVEAFTAGIDSTDDEINSLCAFISSTQNHNNSDILTQCISTIETRTLLSGILHGVLFAGITLTVSKLASRRKFLMISFLLIPMLSTLVAIYNTNQVASMVLYVGMMMTNLCMGLLFSYYVDLYPTSHRGMAACLGVVVARTSGLCGVQVLGQYVMTHCTMTFYGIAACLLSGALLAAFLPPDKPKTQS